MTPLRIFIGYDSREAVAYHVLAHSILRRASIPVALIPLTRQSLTGIYQRPPQANESTEFSFTRFLVPYLSNYEGLSVFMDCDMLCTVDIADLVKDRDGADVWVCQHSYEPSTPSKFLGQTQTIYPRKNWSSLMVFNNARCQALTPENVAHESGAWLHQFGWTNCIGGLPLTWNWLVGEYPENPDAQMYHYTLGGPWFPDSMHVDHADLWRAELAHLRA